MLRLPALEELSGAQRRVLELPLDESHIITGPPGSGKSVMAIYRAAELHRKLGEPTLLIMYSRVLSRYAQSAVEALGIGSLVRNYHAWFRDWFRTAYGVSPPMASQYHFDWLACLSRIIKSGLPAELRPHLIVDEGQDMPKEFYALLRELAATMTVFADENQQLTEDRSRIEEIQAASGIRSLVNLGRNYRNTRAVADVAATFYTGAGSPPVDLAEDAPEGQPPILAHDPALHLTVERLLHFERENPGQQIGVFLPYTRLLQSFYNRLQGKTRNPVEIYMSTRMGPRTPVEFKNPGIKIISYTSAKGLEFDTVFLPELQANRSDPTSVNFRMQLYVMCSRAKNQLWFVYSGEGEPGVVRSLPLELLDDRRG